MGRIFTLAAVVVLLGFGIGGFATAQDGAGTPAAELCASPVASPAATPPGSPEASPDVVTDGTPSVIATEVVNEIAGALDTVVCGTPQASPAAG